MSAAVQSPWLLDTFITGKPAAQGSKRHVGNGRLVEQSKAVAPWRALVAWHVAQEWSGGPLAGPVELEVAFLMPRPTSTPKRVTPAAVKRPDLDKLCRALFDAISGICYRDDSQVVLLIASKRLSELNEQPGCRVQIREVA